MIGFVNAKINLGLNIVSRRPDGYHNLQTVFYPIGVKNGTHFSPEPFCDILEIVPIAGKTGFKFTGNIVNCPLEKNLVYKAYRTFFGDDVPTGYHITLEKHLPDGAGMGGGSADATFTLCMLNNLSGNKFTDKQIEEMAVKLGADCPVFVRNVPAYAEGVGEQLEEIPPVLKGKWLVVVKPDVYVSTKEAFAGVTPHYPKLCLRDEIMRPIGEWKSRVVNDFEDSIFPAHRELPELKHRLYNLGAEFALMTGSGSSIYGIFKDRHSALVAIDSIGTEVPYRAVALCD